MKKQGKAIQQNERGKEQQRPDKEKQGTARKHKEDKEKLWKAIETELTDFSEFH